MKSLLFPKARTAAALLLLLTGLGVGAFASGGDPDFINAQDILLGTWKVDLRPNPEAEPYYKSFVVTSVEGRSFSGSFYDTPISQGRINTDWGKLRIAFVTTDGSGPYYHSATLESDSLEGLSNSTGRDFLAYWSAVKEPADARDSSRSN